MELEEMAMVSIGIVGTVILCYLVCINLTGFVSMGLDKRKARKNQWRTKEKTLFAVALLGGSIGSNLGMKLFRHKTKHIAFVYGMPAILVLQILLVVFAYFLMHK